MKKPQTQQMEWYESRSRKKREKKPDRWPLILTCSFLACCLLLYGAGAARSRVLTVDKQTVFSGKLLNQAGILLLSDLHSDSFGQENEELLNAIKKQAEQVQIIVLAGDIIDDQDPDPKEELEFCRKLSEIRPVCFSPGNSELARNDWPSLKENLENMGIPVLDKEYFRVSLNGNDVFLGGLYDYSFALNGNDTVEEERMDPQTVQFLQDLKEEQGFKIVISHRPDSFYFNQSGNYWELDLVVSGHTHGGQSALVPLSWRSRDLQSRYNKGLYTENGVQLYVTSGIGTTHISARFLMPPSITIITAGIDCSSAASSAS